MKKIIIMSVLSLSTSVGFAQNANHNRCQPPTDMPANATPVFPESAYTSAGDPSCPPCYEYTTKRGLKVMECPDLLFKTESTEINVAKTAQTSNNNDMAVQSESSYTGNYPVNCSKDLNMPANAWPVWPKSDYRATSNTACAPCYEYRTKNGLLVMECPNLIFTDEKK
jgi:hypothetical protein